MGAAGGITYAVLRGSADYNRFAFLMKILPINTEDPGIWDYDSFEPPASNYFEAYWRDTYDAFSFEDDLQRILEDILDPDDFSGYSGFSYHVVNPEYTWEDVLEDWETSPYQEFWSYSWKIVAEDLRFLQSYFREYFPDRLSLFKMILKEWATEVKSMIDYTGYQETWT